MLQSWPESLTPYMPEKVKYLRNIRKKELSKNFKSIDKVYNSVNPKNQISETTHAYFYDVVYTRWVYEDNAVDKHPGKRVTFLKFPLE